VRSESLALCHPVSGDLLPEMLATVQPDTCSTSSTIHEAACTVSEPLVPQTELQHLKSNSMQRPSLHLFPPALQHKLKLCCAVACSYCHMSHVAWPLLRCCAVAL
jgi:hypothetical protein